MSAPQLEIIVIAALTAVACALPGVFLVLRRMSLLSDAISHAILVGILNSPLLIVAAMLTGVLTVALVELLVRSGRLKEDASIGLVFPALFSIGVILISRYAGNIHLDTDAVLLGELVYAPFDRATFLGLEAPKALWTMSAVLVINLAFIAALYKELKLTAFDGWPRCSVLQRPCWATSEPGPLTVRSPGRSPWSAVSFSSPQSCLPRTAGCCPRRCGPAASGSGSRPRCWRSTCSTTRARRRR